MIRSIITLLAFVVTAYSINPYEQSPRFFNLNLSPDGKHLAFDDVENPGLYLLKTDSDTIMQVADHVGSSYRISWSSDSKYIGFKQFHSANGKKLQSSAIFDIENKRIQLPGIPALRVGIPSFSNTGLVSFTQDEMLLITDLEGHLQNSFDLGNYANQAPISPHGKYVVFNDVHDRMHLLNIEDGTSQMLNLHSSGCFNPTWSANSEYILVSSLTGMVISYHVSSEKITNFGKGQNLQWIKDSNTVVFTKIDAIEGRELLYTENYYCQADGSFISRIESEIALFGNLTAAKKDFIYFSDYKNRIMKSEFTKASNTIMQIRNPLPINLEKKIYTPIETSGNFLSKTSAITEEFYFDIPYVHQRYDTPNDFDGNWACGATAATMCLVYYELLEKWPETVSIPYTHVSDYGNYISRVYTYNSYTFNIWASDPDGNRGYGGYGHIVRNGSQAWADTKGYMADYASKHGLNSSVDWNPSRAKLITEVESRMPFVLLNSLTDSGHYISVIGYEGDATTIIVNDPYGNKNNGYANYYGQRSRYDWPGYNNGNSSLNTVWCYIYFRGSVPNYPDLIVSSSTNIDTLNPSSTFPLQIKIKNMGNIESTESNGTIYFSNDPQSTEDDEVLKSVIIPQIQPSDSLVIVEPIALPDSIVSRPDYYILFEAKPDSSHHEVNLSNNTTKSSFSVEGYPEIYGCYPDPLTVTDQANLSIGAKFKNFVSPIDIDSVQIFLNGVDVTPLSTVSSRKVEYTAHEGLGYGKHKVKVIALNKSNYKSVMKWQFEISTETAIEENKSGIPKVFELFSNYPNPFNSSTRIPFSLPEKSEVTISIFNVQGKRIKSFIKTNYQSGRHSVTWNGKTNSGEDVASGIYIVNLKTKSFSASNRILFIK